MMTKQEHFLWVVQTIMLSNVGNVASQPDQAKQFRHVISATGVAFTASEAIRASGLIPKDLDAIDAAAEFCSYLLENLRPIGAVCPPWFSLP